MENNNTLCTALDSLKEDILKSRDFKSTDVDESKTALLIVDMINGFAKSGALYSPSIEKINEPIAKLSLRCEAHDIPVIAFCDSHNENSPEFSSYPVHCLKDTEESRITDEIASSANIIPIRKNSTNGYLEPEFQKWLKNNKNVNTFIIVGCCTDICVQQLALTLKAHFNRLDLESRVIVPISLSATFDTPEHNAELCSLSSFYNMKLNSIEIVSKIV